MFAKQIVVFHFEWHIQFHIEYNFLKDCQAVVKVATFQLKQAYMNK